MSPNVRSPLLLGTALILIAASVPALAQTIPTPAPDTATSEDGADKDSVDENNQILVIATRIKGQVDAAQAPIITLNEEEIASYGASSLSDLITALSPQTGSGRGRGGSAPVILLNGQRIASFREMRNFTPEAIKRVEVLPEEVALRYGYPPNQRVINFILKDNFASRAVELEDGQPWNGGSSTVQAEASLLKIKGPNRFNLRASTEDTTPLTEAERAIIQSPGSVPSVATDPDPAQFRTLIADSRQFDLTGSWATGLGDGGKSGSLSANAGVTVNDTRTMSGLNLVTLTAPGGATALRSLPDPLERRNRTVAVQGGGGYNGNLGKWLLSATVDGSHTESDTRIERRADTSSLVAAAAAGTLPINGSLPILAPSGEDLAETRTDNASSLVTLIGRPLALPAGEVSLTVKGGFAYTAIESRDMRSSAGVTNLDRSELSTGFNLALPLTSRRDNVLGAVGDITLNFSGGLSQLSDFGALTDWSAGVTWALTDKLGLQASYIVNQAAPGLSDLGAPTTITFNVPVYDFTRGETVLVSVTGGGNPLLKQEEQRDLKIGVNWQLPFLSNSNMVVEYFRNRSENVTASFPLLTPAIEAAYPGRVTRDASSRLVSIDRRPITLASQQGERLRWGFNLSGMIGKPTPGGAGGMMGGRPGGGGRGPGGGGPGAGGGRGPGGGGPMMGMFGGGQGRWNVGIYHTWRFSEQVQITPGGAVLDLLNGDALTGGGVARHTLELEGGVFNKGVGLRISGRYTAPTRVRASGVPGSSDLRFGGLAGVDLRLFVNLDQKPKLIKAVPFLKGTRISLRVDNLFDARQRVTDGTGTVPLSYQPNYIDPRGRFIGVELRKQF